MALLGGLSCLWPWGKKGGGMSFMGALPDCIVEKILHELPVDQVLRCRAVCRRWKRLIDGRKFAVLANPVKQPSAVVFQCVRVRPDATGMEGGDEPGTYIIHPRPDNKRLTKGGITRMRFSGVEVANPPVIRGSCDGFIIFGRGLHLPSRYFIYNPVTRESVSLGKKIAETVYGFYFHPSREEYRLLCVGRRAANHQFGYYTCDLRGESRNELGLYPYGPREGQVPHKDLAPSPLIVGGSLYHMMRHIDPYSGWQSNIMALDLDTEELRFMPAPKLDDSFGYLCEAEGRLCFFCWGNSWHNWWSHHGPTWEIWSLQDPASWSWIKRFSIKVQLPYYIVALPLVISDRELIVNWVGRGLARCDVSTGRLEMIIKLRGEKEEGLTCYAVASCSLSLFPLSRLRL